MASIEAIGYERFGELLEGTADGVFLINAHRRIVYWSASAQRLLGYAPEEAQGVLCYEVMAGGDSSVCRSTCPVLNSALRGDLVPAFDIVSVHKDGHDQMLNVSTLALPGAVAHIFRPIPARRWATPFAALNAPSVLSAGNLCRSGRGKAQLKQLSEREREVLGLLAQGMTAKAIAAQLCLSECTARNHIQKVLSKLGLRSSKEAVVYAWQNHLRNEP